MGLARKTREQDAETRVRSELFNTPAAQTVLGICRKDPRFREWFVSFLTSRGLARRGKFRELRPEMERRGISEEYIWLIESLTLDRVGRPLLIELATLANTGGQLPAGGDGKPAPQP